MAVIALTSARGAPGVSTTALAMTLLWPRPAVLAECDPAGGSSTLAGFLRGTVDHARGLLHLAVAHRHGELEPALWPQLVPLTTGRTGTSGEPAQQRWLLPGLSDAAQAPSTAALWGPLAGVLASLERAGTDVLVDAGRAGAAHAPIPLLRQADVVLLMTGTSLPAVAAARARLGTLKEDLSATDGAAGPSRLGLLLVREGRPYTARELAKALGVPVVAAISWDPTSAEVLSVGAAPGRRFDSSPLVRSTRGAISAVQALLAQHRDRLGAPSTAAGPVLPATSLAAVTPVMSLADRLAVHGAGHER
jgi:hypothetical protein